jgi:hypothetical protein
MLRFPGICWTAVSGYRGDKFLVHAGSKRDLVNRPGGLVILDEMCRHLSNLEQVGMHSGGGCAVLHRGGRLDAYSGFKVEEAIPHASHRDHFRSMASTGEMRRSTPEVIVAA